MKNNKRFVLSALAFLVTLALVSCKPLHSYAVDIGIEDQTQIQEYLDTASENMQQIDFSLDSDQDGNRSVRLKIYGLQKLAFSEQSSFFDDLDFGSAPDSVTVSGGGGVAFYRRTENGDPIPCTISACMPGQIIASSDDFALSIRFDTAQMNAQAEPYSSSSSAGFKYTGNTIWSYINYNDSKGYFSNYRRDQNIFNNSTYAIGWSTNYVPVMSSGTRADLVYFGLGENLILPLGTVDTSRPWDYYNNVLLPYMEEEFPGYDEYFVFPNGYDPPVQPSTVPVEYPTLPGFDLALETNGTQPASDYAYNIPELPEKNIAVPAFDFSSINPAEVMAPVADNLRSMWALVTSVLTEFNLFPYVALAVFAAIVAGLMHLGK